MPARAAAGPREADIAVVGAGGAGLYATLCAARAGARAVLISATPLAQTASYWAQGGLAAALAADDSAQQHLSDTEHAGRGLVRTSAAEVLAREAPECVSDLQALGVRFDADRFGRLALGLEGGHSVRRVVHAGGSATGRRLVRQLSALAVKEQLVSVLENTRARSLWLLEDRCRGVLCDDGELVAARAVVIATGGAAALWARTTNPPGSQGVGLLLAHAHSAIAGLYAVGEASSTGLHGANRLASNSLSECFVFARRAVAHALAQPPPAPRRPSERQLEELLASPPPPAATETTRAALWRHAGIERSGEGLSSLLEDPHPLARLIARCALERRESRGAHTRCDYPELDPSLDRRHVVVDGGGDLGWQRWD